MKRTVDYKENALKQVGRTGVPSGFSESANFSLMKGILIGSSILVSRSRVSRDSVITQQILGEQLRRC